MRIISLACKTPIMRNGCDMLCSAGDNQKREFHPLGGFAVRILQKYFIFER